MNIYLHRRFPDTKGESILFLKSAEIAFAAKCWMAFYTNLQSKFDLRVHVPGM